MCSNIKLTFRRLLPSEASQIEAPRDYQFQIWNNYYGSSRDNDYEDIIVYDENHTEVARVELDMKLSTQKLQRSSYPVKEISTPIIEIQFIDVRSPYRLNGLGTKIIHFLESTFPYATLAALSEKADGFWESVGWLRVNPKDSMRRTLFLLIRDSQ